MIKNTWEMYEMINRRGKITFKLLRGFLGWSEKKTKRHLNKLIKKGLIGLDDGCEFCGNKDKIYYSIPFQELLEAMSTPSTSYKPLDENND